LRNSRQLLALVLLAASALPVAAQSVPAAFTIDTLLTLTGGDSTAHVFCYLPGSDGRILIAGRAGALTIYTTNAPSPASAAIGTIPSVETGSEKGMLGLCADPNWPTSPYIYVWYPPTTTGAMRLARWQIGGADLANPNGTGLSLMAGSEHIILNDPPDGAFNHNGGELAFGPDGMLYVSMGDDASACQAQDRTQLQGKVLRITTAGLPAGAGGPPAKSLLDPGDNPWSSSANANERLVLCYGLRNPVSFNMDPVTGDLFIADVGQNAREELDYYARSFPSAPVGVNFGWPWKEGINNFNTCGGSAPAGMTDPLDDYPQSTGGVSIMAAGFIRNAPSQQYQFPATYDRNVFHNDYFNGTITRLTPSGATWTKVPGYWGTGFVGALRFKQDPINGDVKFLHHSSTYATNGVSLRRIRPSAPLNQLLITAGDAQVATLGETFAVTLEARALSPASVPLANHPVTFAAVVPNAVTFGSPMPVMTDANGYAQTTVTTGPNPGSAAVKVTTQGGDPAGLNYSLYQRGLKITLIQGSPTDTMVLALTNNPPGMNPIVNYEVMFGFPQPSFPTPFGTMCVNPLDTINTLVFEDPLNAFTGFQVRGGTGNPSKTNIYSGLPQSLAGLMVRFQAVAYTPGFAAGDWWITNCVNVTF
jgi:glucose/arabinose dehydrogenase